eukprot:PhM_4_TR9184/c0_g1_i1/m.67712
MHKRFRSVAPLSPETPPPTPVFSTTALTWGGEGTIETLIDREMNSLTAPDFKCDATDGCKYVPGVTEMVSKVTTMVLMLYPLPPGNTSSWSPLFGSANAKGVGIAYFDTIESTQFDLKHSLYGSRLAVVNTFMDLSDISDFMTSMPLPAGSRVFGVSAIGSEAGSLIGASHGGATRFVDGRPSLVHCSESNDTVIAAICNWIILEQPDQFSGLSEDKTYVVNAVNDNDEDFLEHQHFVRAVSVVDVGLRWTVLVAIPRKAILSEVDASVEKVTMTIESERKTIESQRHDYYILIYVILTLVEIAFVAAATGFTILVTRPMFKLDKEMAAVAKMDLEAVDVNAPLSGLEEIDSLQLSFYRMCVNLREYRHYLPASILAMMRRGGDLGSDDASFNEDEDDDLEEEGDDGCDVIQLRSSIMEASSSAVLSVSRTSSNVGTEMVAVKSPTLPPHFGTFAATTATDLASIAQKHISVLLVNVRNTHTEHFPLQNNKKGTKQQQQQQPVVCGNKLLQFESYIEAVLSTVVARHGTPDVFLGDRFLATWNTVKRRATHRTNACHAALEIQHRLVNSCDVSIAVSSSVAVCGNMGCDGMKKYTYIGPCASVVHHLERRNAAYGTTILTHDNVYDEANLQFVLQKVDCVDAVSLQQQNSNRTHTALWELIKVRDEDEDEWMYVLEDQEQEEKHVDDNNTNDNNKNNGQQTHNPNRITEVVEAFYRDDLDVAERLINKLYVATNRRLIVDFWSKRIEFVRLKLQDNNASSSQNNKNNSSTAGDFSASLLPISGQLFCPICTGCEDNNNNSTTRKHSQQYPHQNHQNPILPWALRAHQEQQRSSAASELSNNSRSRSQVVTLPDKLIIACDI